MMVKHWEQHKCLIIEVSLDDVWVANLKEHYTIIKINVQEKHLWYLSGKGD